MPSHAIPAALRRLARDRLHSAVTLVSLVLGFTTVILIGAYLRNEFDFERMFPDRDRTYVVLQTQRLPGLQPLVSETSPVELASVLDTLAPEIETITRLAPAAPILRRGDVASVEDRFVWADPNAFEVLPLTIVGGDLATALARPDGLVLTRELARKYFGRDKPIGEVIELDPAGEGADGQTPVMMTVAAVVEDLPAETHLNAKAFGSALSALAPQNDRNSQTALPSETSTVQVGDTAAAITYLRLPSAAAASRVRARLDQANERLARPLLGARSFNLTPLREMHMPTLAPGEIRNAAMRPPGDPKVAVWLSAMAGLILGIAVINFVTLMTARGARRAMEVGVRKAMGARRGDLVAQFMAEAAVAALVALVFAMGMAEILAPGLGRALDRDIALAYLREPVWTLALVVGAIVVGLLAGFYPALVLSNFRPAAVLGGGSAGAGGAGSRLVRQALVVCQFGILIVLMLVTMTVYRQVQFAIKDATDRVGGNVLLVTAPNECSDAIQARFRTIQGVVDAVCASGFANRVFAPGHVLTEGRRLQVEMIGVDPRALAFFGQRPLAGRTLSRQDDPQGPAAPITQVVVNQAAVRTLGLGGATQAVGRTLTLSRGVALFGGPGGGLVDTPTIVGVAPDASIFPKPVRPTVYYAANTGLQGPLAVRLSQRDASATLARMDQTWRELGHVRPSKAVYLRDEVQRFYQSTRNMGLIVAIGAGLALVIACLGLFALSAFLTEQRTREIGIRKALGARQGEVVRLLLWQFSRPVCIAIVLALPAAFLILTWWLSQFPARVVIAPWTFVAAAGGALLIAWLTVLTHAVSAARAPPVNALRHE